MSRFLQTLRSGRALLMDGAMGTELLRAGLPPGEPCESWNRTHPERIRAIYRAYVDAGAEVLLTNSFQAPEEETFARAVALARVAAGDERFVLAAVGPGKEARFSPRADAILLETCTDERDLDRPAKTPLLISMTYRRSEQGTPITLSGLHPEACARLADKYPVAALGVNCGRDIGMDQIIEIVRRYRQVTELPLFARPNAGTPGRDGGYPLTPAAMAARLPELLEAGACMVGGCCGTTPEHIAAMRPVLREWNRRNGK